MNKKEKIIKKVRGLLTKYNVSEDELGIWDTDLDAELEDNDFVDDEEEMVEVEEKPEPEEVEVETETELEDKEEEAEVEDQDKGIDFDAKIKEMTQSIEGLVARLETVEGIVSKLGKDVEEESFGVEPTADAEEDAAAGFYARMKSLREGR